MLSIFGNTIVNHCDNLSRRSFIRIGSLGLGAGLALPEILRANARQQIDKTKSIIMVYLCGGPTQHETFDPKPDSPQEIRGSYNPISTKIPGIQFCELMASNSKGSRRSQKWHTPGQIVLMSALAARRCRRLHPRR